MGDGWGDPRRIGLLSGLREMKRPSRSRGGFTLFEMILAATIFMILAGGIYFSVSSSVSAANDLAVQQIDSRQMSSLMQFLRKGLLNLPAEAEISVTTRSRGQRGDAVDLVIRRAPGAFGTGALEVWGGGVVLSALPDGKGKSTLSITRFAEKTTESEMDGYLEGAMWLPLLENVETVRWRFWDQNLSRWLEIWERKDIHPPLIELTLRRAGESEQVSLFRLPQLTASLGGKAVPTPSPKEGPQ